ncbi:MAG: type III-A CRISPR-associated RAMP protein Csm4 [Chloroflexi bacterium]|nr:MAG: type III-A CRISPR-associated RAMP protein Csm4 [Chloroflexota bacterium]
MAERVYQLMLKTPLHVGVGGIDQEETLSYIPSDTLFSAIVSAWSLIDPAHVSDKLAPFLTQPATPTFVLTSAFPFAGPVRFFPRPLRLLDVPDDLPHKRIKKAIWVSEAIFHQLRRGQLPKNELDETVNFIQGGQVWLTRTERDAIIKELELPHHPKGPVMEISVWVASIAPRVTVDRLGSGSNIFHTGRIKFSDKCGLWFAVRGEDFSTLEQGLTVLQDEGFGGLRSTGHGAFEYSIWKNLQPLPTPKLDEYFINLARFAPADTTEVEAMLAPDNTAYALTVVKGWCQDDTAHPWRRKQLRLVAEGAYLRWKGGFPGQLANVTPATRQATFNDRNVYRYGFAFPVGTM